VNHISLSVQNEMVKLFHLKKYKIILVLMCLFTIGLGLLGKFMKGFIGLSLSNTPLTGLSIAAGFLFPLVIALAAADLFTAEQENGTIKAVLTRPVSRINIFTSKALAIMIYIALALLVCLIIGLICSILFNGADLSVISEALLSYAVSIIPMCPIVLFAVAVSQLCRNSSSTVMLTVFGYLAIMGFGTVLSGASPMMFTSYTGWYKLFIGAAVPMANILNAFALLAAYSLIFYAAGSWAFENKEY
jgi:ABC-2 type transport system permease protein